MNYNPLQNLQINELIYIHGSSEVNSRLWIESGAMLSAHQMGMQERLFSLATSDLSKQYNK